MALGCRLKQQTLERLAACHFSAFGIGCSGSGWQFLLSDCESRQTYLPRLARFRDSGNSEASQSSPGWVGFALASSVGTLVMYLRGGWIWTSGASEAQIK